jgi:hypothetical protein
MGKRAQVIRVFIASPGDVSLERDRAELVINEVNRDLGDALGVRLEAIRWENYVSPLMGRPEEVVLDQVKVSKWDIFIGILWLRFGSPTGAFNTSRNEEFLSGTEEEFHIAYESWKNTGSPKILFYRCTRSPQSITEINAEQFGRVTKFFDGFSYDKEHPGIVCPFAETNVFERRVREDLAKLVRSIVTNEPVECGSLLNVEHQSFGFKNLFLAHKNVERNDEKRKAIIKASNMKLVAHSGHSFFSAVGHRYRKELTERFEQGATFKAVLTNPWSLTTLLIAIASQDQSTILHDCYNRILDGKLDPINIIEGSVWYSIKLKDSISGYLQLVEKYGTNIELRFTRHDLPATVFLTEEYCSFEPYLNVNLSSRSRLGMMTFEIQTDKSSYLYSNSESYFDFMYNTSISYDQFIKNEANYKSTIIEYLKD